MEMLEHCGYREKSVREVFLRVPRELVSGLEKELTKKAGLPHAENHHTFKFMDNDGNEVYVTFSDFTATFGKSVGPF
jgi:hypothetical protein